MTTEVAKQRPVPQPEQNPLFAPYWEYAKQHEFRLQRCRACGYYIHFPKARCPRCASADLEWARVSGRGKVDSYILVYYLDAPGFDEPYVTAQVSPEEQDTVRIVCNILECAMDDVYVGMPVEVTFEEIRDGWVLPQFKPAPGARLRSRGETP